MGEENKSDPTTPPEEAPKLSIFDKAETALKSKETLATKIKTLETQLAERDAKITQLEADLATATAEAEKGRELAQRVATLETEAEDVAGAAANIAASNHSDPEDVPGASGEIIDDAKSLREKMAATDCPKEKGVYARQLSDLRKGVGRN